MHRKQLRSVTLINCCSINNRQGAYLDGTAINQETIQLLRSLGSGVGLAKDDRSNTTAGTVLVVGEHDLLNRTSGLGEVFL
jgi:hypothetical protein